MYVYKTVSEVFNSGPFHKSGHKCFDRSGPSLQISLYVIHRVFLTVMNIITN